MSRKKPELELKRDKETEVHNLNPVLFFFVKLFGEAINYSGTKLPIYYQLLGRKYYSRFASLR